MKSPVERALFSWLVVLATLTFPTSAQEADPEAAAAAGSDDPLIQALEREKQIAELKQAIAVAEKAELAAKLPETETTGSDGAVTLGENAGYFAELLAHGTLVAAAADIARAVGSPEDGGEIILTSDSELAQPAQLWELMTAKLSEFESRFDQLLDAYPTTFEFAETESVTGFLASSSALLGAAADVASFFRSSTAIRARSFTLSETALEALVAASLSSSWKVYDPTLSLSKTRILGQLQDVSRKRADVEDRRKVLEKSVSSRLDRLGKKRLELEKAQDTLKTLEGAKAPDPKQIAAAKDAVFALRDEIRPLANLEVRWKRVAEELDAAIVGFGALVKEMTTGVEGKRSPIEAVAVADVIKRRPDARILFLEIASEGGEIHVSKSVWRSRLTYVGGTVVAFLLASQDGQVLESGSFTQADSESVRAKNASSLSHQGESQPR